MTFSSSFGRVFSPTFQPNSQAAAVASGGWWDLNGTITSCVAAYQPIGAADLTASYTNLANPGTYTAYSAYGSPSYDISVGWTPSATKWRPATRAPFSDLVNRTVIVRGVKAGYGTVFQNNVNNQINHNWNQYSYFRNASTTNTMVTIPIDSEYTVAMNADGWWLNGAYGGAGTFGSEAASTDFCTIGNNKGGGLSPENSIAAAAIYTAKLTSAQIIAVMTAMATL